MKKLTVEERKERPELLQMVIIANRGAGIFAAAL